MSKTDLSHLLDSESSLVVVEAPAGCGKTYQGGKFAARIARTLAVGRVLILTHTHAARAAFTKQTTSISDRVEIKTIDSLVVQIASAYHESLDLPADVGLWVRNNENGHFELAKRVVRFLTSNPMIREALVRRFPILICDEHQDANDAQHDIVMQLNKAGARTRIFGDPMQCIYAGISDKQIRKNWDRWNALRESSVSFELEHPYRWDDGSPELGQWVLRARKALQQGEPIDVSDCPVALTIIHADNSSPVQGAFQLTQTYRKNVDAFVRSKNEVLILTSNNQMVGALRAYWARQYSIWEGQTRPALESLVNKIRVHSGNPEKLCEATVQFVIDTAVGFTKSGHGDRMISEAAEGCSRKTRGKPAELQTLARCIVDQPNHVGVSTCLKLLKEKRKSRTKGFENIQIDHVVEFHEAIRLGTFQDVDEGFSEITLRRSFANPTPSGKTISNVHKAKGLECDHALIIPCDRKRFGETLYSRCKLYVAISRAKHSLAIATSRIEPSNLLTT